MTTLLNPQCSASFDSRCDSPAKLRKVLHVVNGEHYAGAARVQDLLALGLPQFGYEVSFACVFPDRFEAERQSQNCALYNVPMTHRLDLRPALRVAELVRTEGFDLIHSHTTRSAMIATTAAQLTKVPFVHHVHCQMNTEVGQHLKTRINKSIERFACGRANGVIAVSGSIKRFLNSNGFTRTEISVVPNGVPAAPALRSAKTANDSWTIGMVALLRERKGLETLIEALPKLHKNFDARLRIVGRFETPEYESEIRSLAEYLNVADRIDWTGFTRNVPGEIAQMDVLVLPSVLPEGMPMVLLEAMSAGVPVVGSAVDGITDVIRHEQNGLLTEPSNADSLASQLKRILSDECNWRHLRSNCLTDYEKNYSDVAMAAGIARVYDSILAGSRRNTATAQEPKR